MSRVLHIVMPMSGRGSRFTKAGITTPKPLITVDGKPMFMKALESLDAIDCEKKYTIIIRSEHVEQYNLAKKLADYLDKVNIIITSEEPIGPVVDAYRAEKYVLSGEGMMVMDCDMWFQSEGYNQMVQASLNGESDIAGGLLTFPADNPRYSYAKFGQDGIVTETAEKSVISGDAITGAYFFATTEDFLRAAKELLKKPLDEKMPEYYMSLLYNILIDEGKKIKAARVDEFASFGTPEELEAYHRNQ